MLPVSNRRLFPYRCCASAKPSLSTITIAGRERTNSRRCFATASMACHALKSAAVVSKTKKWIFLHPEMSSSLSSVSEVMSLETKPCLLANKCTHAAAPCATPRRPSVCKAFVNSSLSRSPDPSASNLATAYHKARKVTAQKQRYTLVRNQSDIHNGSKDVLPLQSLETKEMLYFSPCFYQLTCAHSSEENLGRAASAFCFSDALTMPSMMCSASTFAVTFRFSSPPSIPISLATYV